LGTRDISEESKKNSGGNAPHKEQQNEGLNSQYSASKTEMHRIDEAIEKIYLHY
jgi:hypothetical protein